MTAVLLQEPVLSTTNLSGMIGHINEETTNMNVFESGQRQHVAFRNTVEYIVILAAVAVLNNCNIMTPQPILYYEMIVI